MRKLLTALSLFSLPFLSSATTIEYTNRAAWEAAVGNVSTIDFEGLPIPTFTGLGGPSNAYSHSITINQVTFTGQSGPILAGYTGPTPNPVVVPLSASQNSWVAAWGSGDTLGASLGGMLISLPAGTKAFGVDIMTTFQAFVSGQAYFEADLSDGEVFNSIPTYAPPTRAFVGFVSTNALSSVYLNSTGSFAMIDNFSLPGAASLPSSPAPEPSTSGLLGLGGLAAGLAGYARRSLAAGHSLPARF